MPLLFDASEISERESTKQQRKKPALIYIQYTNLGSIENSVMQITWV